MRPFPVELRHLALRRYAVPGQLKKLQDDPRADQKALPSGKSTSCHRERSEAVLSKGQLQLPKTCQSIVKNEAYIHELAATAQQEMLLPLPVPLLLVEAVSDDHCRLPRCRCHRPY